MNVAVITPYYKESLEQLRRAHESVMRQSFPCRHIFVADGWPRPELDDWDVDHLKLPSSHRDNGNTPRGLGAISALNRGFEGFAFLDADNWFAEDHVATLVEICRGQVVDVAFSDRTIVLASGETCVAEDPDMLARAAVDTSCIFITARAAFLLPLWCMMDPVLGPICDRVMFSEIKKRGVAYAWSERKTLFYESRWANHYRALGHPPPPDEHVTDWPGIQAAFSAKTFFERTHSAPRSGPPGLAAAFLQEPS